MKFTAIVERCPSGRFFGYVPELKAAYTEAETLDQLMLNLRDVIELEIEDRPESQGSGEIIGVYQIEVGEGQPSKAPVPNPDEIGERVLSRIAGGIGISLRELVDRARR